MRSRTTELRRTEWIKSATYFAKRTINHPDDAFTRQPSLVLLIVDRSTEFPRLFARNHRRDASVLRNRVGLPTLMHFAFRQWHTRVPAGTFRSPNGFGFFIKNARFLTFPFYETGVLAVTFKLSLLI